MEIQLPVAARVQHRDRERLPVGGEREVADEALIEDRVDRLSLVGSPLAMATDRGSLGFVIVQIHA